MYVINSNEIIQINKLSETKTITGENYKIELKCIEEKVENPEKIFEIELKPLQEFIIIGIRKLYYEPFCFGVTCKYNVIQINQNQQIKLPKSEVIEKWEQNFKRLLYVSEKTLYPKNDKYYDFIHSRFPIDIKKVCAIVNTKNNAVEMYTQKFPEEMKEILKIPKIGDMVDVTFYDKTRCDDKQGTYLGEWKSKNPFVKHGRGMFIFDDGRKYVGQIKDDCLDGFGKMYLVSGDIIEIQFEADEMDGIGYLISKNGQKKRVQYDLGGLID